MNRRRFILNAILGSISSQLILPRARAQKGRVIVQGADPTGSADSTTAFLNTIAALPKAHGRLSIPPGTYRFRESGGSLFKIKNIFDLEIDGNGSLLVFEGNTRPFHIENCEQVTVRNLRIDWSRPPFSQGVVLEAGPKWLKVKVDSEYPVSGEEPIEAIGEYDRALGLPSINGLDLYGHVRSVRLLGPQVLKIYLSAPISLQAGATVVMRHRVYGVNLFELARCKNVYFEEVTLHAAPGMGIVAQAVSGMHFNRLRVMPRAHSGRMLSLNADAVHLINCKGNIELLDCSFQGMGDDAINICSSFWRIAQVIDGHTWVVEGRGPANGEWGELPSKGTTVDLCDAKTLAVLGSAVVSESCSALQRAVIKVEQPVAVKEGTILCDSQRDTNSIVANCMFKGNRARAIVAHNNIKIMNNTFYGQSLAAILLAADAWWMEGPVVRNVEIDGNSFDYNYFGQCAGRRGAITVDTAEDFEKSVAIEDHVNKRVSISSNKFSRSYGSAIFVNRTSELSITKNTFESSSILQHEKGPKRAVVLNDVSCPYFAGNVMMDSEVVIAPGCDLPTESGSAAVIRR
jgi:hypothetical protein